MRDQGVSSGHPHYSQVPLLHQSSQKSCEEGQLEAEVFVVHLKVVVVKPEVFIVKPQVVVVKPGILKPQNVVVEPQWQDVFLQHLSVDTKLFGTCE